VICDDHNSKLPDCLTTYVEKITVVWCFPLQCRRRLGIYREGETVIWLDVNSSNFVATAEGMDLGAMRSLYEQIRAGKVVPTEDWEGPQNSPPEPQISVVMLMGLLTQLVNTLEKLLELGDDVTPDLASSHLLTGGGGM
jgi:hypothetical protein